MLRTWPEFARHGQDFIARYPTAADTLRQRVPRGTALDGEVVALNAEGRTSFNALQSAGRQTAAVFYAFDILVHGGRNPYAVPTSACSESLLSKVNQSIRDFKHYSANL